jgi:hypothetical protein
MFWIKNSYFFLLLFLLASCGSRSLDDFEEEGEGVMRSLIQEMQSIRTRDQLLASTIRLKRHFDRLIDIMIAAEESLYAHPEIDRGEFGGPNHELSDKLRIELNRLYRIEGGRKIIEKCQEKALHRLDAFEKQHGKGFCHITCT